MTGVREPRSLVDNLRRSAQLHPDRCAIQEGDKRLTFAALWGHARDYCNRLLAGGVSRGDRVALILSNGPEFAAAYYGVLMAGGVVVPLNASGKARDFVAWLHDCTPAALVADETNGEVAAAVAVLGEQAPSVYFETAARPDEVAQLSLVGDPCVTVEPGEAACILYTSGTTGRPKGVVLSHRNLVSNTAGIVDYLNLTHDDGIVTILPFYYSYGSSVLHTHIQAGGRLILEKNFVYPHAVVETLAREKATGFAGVPSTYALLLSRVDMRRYDLSAVRYLTQAGGAMSPAVTQRLRDTLPHAKLFVMYGQTEATARLTYLPPDRLDEKIGSVGIPVAGVSIEVRRDDGRDAAAGEVGEVWASGPNVMLGYWGNETATREVIRGGWLKTGDMGRLDKDGFLYLVGRRSDIIKIGAHRVHPQDIEDVIADLEGVAEVAVVGVEDEILGESAKAFVVPSGVPRVTAMQIQAHCKERLAGYKVPKFIELVDSLPKTSSGKVRRTELMGRTKQ